MWRYGGRDMRPPRGRGRAANRKGERWRRGGRGKEERLDFMERSRDLMLIACGSFAEERN